MDVAGLLSRHAGNRSRSLTPFSFFRFHIAGSSLKTNLRLRKAAGSLAGRRESSLTTYRLTQEDFRVEAVDEVPTRLEDAEKSLGFAGWNGSWGERERIEIVRIGKRREVEESSEDGETRNASCEREGENKRVKVSFVVLQGP